MHPIFRFSPDEKDNLKAWKDLALIAQSEMNLGELAASDIIRQTTEEKLRLSEARFRIQRRLRLMAGVTQLDVLVIGERYVVTGSLDTRRHVPGLSS